jgi:protein-S-isoprenylcysteine O-methyltransferase Ste14
MKTVFIALRALLVSAIFLALWIWVASVVRRYDARLGLVLPEWGTLAGLFLIVAGSALMLACVSTFVIVGEGTPAPLDPPAKFVSRGPYRYVRNPMYIGGFCALLGLALFWRSPAVILLAPAWWLLFAIFVLVVEEPMLRNKFGADYLAYCRTVPRWLPRRPRS